MRQMTVDDYVALPWVTREEALEDGMYRLTIDGPGRLRDIRPQL